MLLLTGCPRSTWFLAACLRPPRRLYFQTLAVMGVVFLLAGLANMSTILRFRSNEYSGGQDLVNEEM